MRLKTKKKSWSGSTTFALFGFLAGVGGTGAAKLILDSVRPNDPNNLPMSLVIGGATGALIGTLAASGVLAVRTFSGRKETIKI